MNEKLKVIFILSSCWRIYLSVQNSYIHPDEHFQSYNIVASIFNGSGDIPWEFSSVAPARSLIPIYLIYYPIYWLFHTSVSPLVIIYVTRLIFCTASWISIDFCLSRICGNTKKNLTSMSLIYTSYIIWCYQSHTFSNSIETVLLLFCLLIIHKGRLVSSSIWSLFVLALLVTLGLYNRITFILFLVLPGLYLLRLKKKLFIFLFFCVGLVTAFAFIDTALYQNFEKTTGISYNSNITLFGHKLIFAPLSNLIYNSKIENLSHHGIHPRYTHAVINLFQMLGPLYFIFIVNFTDYLKFWYFKCKYQEKVLQKNSQYQLLDQKSVLSLSIISGLAILSLIPHQELRFLIPIQPLILFTTDFLFLSEKFLIGAKKHKVAIITPRAKTLVRNILYVWYLFNFLLSLLMGIFHQGGVLTALDHLNKHPEPAVQFWWRTYPPPTWILGTNYTLLKYDGTNFLSLLTANFSQPNLVVDAMGMEIENLQQLVGRTRRATIISPLGSQKYIDSHLATELIWSNFYHLDMDHLEDFKFGIGIYRSINI